MNFLKVTTQEGEVLEMPILPGSLIKSEGGRRMIYDDGGWVPVTPMLEAALQQVKASEDDARQYVSEVIDAYAARGLSQETIAREAYLAGIRLGTIRGYQAAWVAADQAVDALHTRLSTEERGKLTPHQRQVLGTVAVSRTQEDAAEEFGRAVATIRYHLDKAAAALGLTRRQLTSRLKGDSQLADNESARG